MQEAVLGVYGGVGEDRGEFISSLEMDGIR